MMNRRTRLALSGTVLALAFGAMVWAHCDSMGGPVVAAGRAALQSGDLNVALKWIGPAQEVELRAAFERVLAARKQGGAAAELADRYFLETLVRLHRSGEGEAYSGLKPAGEGITPTLAAADQALESGDVEVVVASLNEQVSRGVRERFARVRQTKQQADQSVAAGREYVAAYVEFVHYIERIEQGASAGAGHVQPSGDDNAH